MFVSLLFSCLYYVLEGDIANFTLLPGRVSDYFAQEGVIKQKTTTYNYFRKLSTLCKQINKQANIMLVKSFPIKLALLQCTTN